jgi:hypothetical protein
LKKKIIKKQKKINLVGKHCSNPQYFVRKYIVVILNQLNIKKIKWTKIILKKIIKKNLIEKHCSNPQCFKEKKTIKLNSQPAQYFKKNKIKDNFEKKIIKKTKKNHKKSKQKKTKKNKPCR